MPMALKVVGKHNMLCVKHAKEMTPFKITLSAIMPIQGTCLDLGINTVAF